MEQKKRSSFENYRRLKRKIRFLYKRGTLFHAKPKFNPLPAAVDKPLKRNKGWRTFRKLRFLLRKGSLLKRKDPQISRKGIPLQVISPKKEPSGFKFRITYRKIRFLLNTGKLWKRTKVEKVEVPKKRGTYRRIRFLFYRGNLFRSQNRISGSIWKSTFKFLIDWNYIKIIINSTVLFLLAYLLVLLILTFSTSFVASAYNIETIIYYYKTFFLVQKENKWIYDSIISVFSTGPFLVLIFSSIALILYSNYIEKNWLFRLFLLWVFCHGFVHFFGEFFLGLILYKGFGYSLAYLLNNFKEQVILVLILFSVTTLILAGLFTAKMFVLSGNIYFNEITEKNRSSFLKSQFLVPCILGTFVILLVKLPKGEPFEIFINLCILLILVPAFIRARFLQDCFFDENPRKIKIRFNLLILGIVLFVIYRVLFGIGLRIG
jgi:hypothetical protein